MGLITINTCQHLGVDTDTGDYFCKIGHLRPTGVHNVSGLVDDDRNKTIPLCLPLQVWGKKFGVGKIKSACDMADEVKTTLF